MSNLNAATQEQIAALVTAGAADTVLPQLGAFTRLVATSGLLGRALTESGSTAEAKAALLSDLTKGKLSEQTIALIVAITDRGASKTVLPTLFDATAELAFAAAEKAGQVDTLENSLYAVNEAIADNSDLRQALTNPGVTDAGKQALLQDLLSAKLDARAFELVRTLVSIKHGKELDTDTKALSESAAARSNKVVAEIRTAVELDDQHRTTLIKAIEAKVGKSVSGRFATDESLVGSVIVRVGDEVFDGSIRHRFEQARVAMARA